MYVNDHLVWSLPQNVGFSDRIYFLKTKKKEAIYLFREQLGIH